MSITDQIITQLKTYAPAFANNVTGAASFETGVQMVANLPYPAAFVIPLTETATENTDVTGLYQMVDCRFAVVVEVSATADRRGQAAASALSELRAAVFAAILNWSPAIYTPNTPKAMYYVGYVPLVLDRARMFAQWEFGIETLITDADGFQATGPALQDVLITDTTHGLTTDVPIATS